MAPALRTASDPANHGEVRSNESSASRQRRGDMTQVKQWVRERLDLRDDATVLVAEGMDGDDLGATVISVLRDDVHREWVIGKDPLDLTEADIDGALRV